MGSITLDAAVSTAFLRAVVSASVELKHVRETQAKRSRQSAPAPARAACSSAEAEAATASRAVAAWAALPVSMLHVLAYAGRGGLLVMYIVAMICLPYRDCSHCPIYNTGSTGGASIATAVAMRPWSAVVAVATSASTAADAAAPPAGGVTMPVVPSTPHPLAARYAPVSLGDRPVYAAAAESGREEYAAARRAVFLPRTASVTAVAACCRFPPHPVAAMRAKKLEYSLWRRGW